MLKKEKCEKKYTRFERARIIGARALQISAGAPPLIKTKENDPIKIAELEYENCKTPLEVVRKFPKIKEKERTGLEI